MNNKGFVFSLYAMLLTIPVVLLAASLLNMMKTGDIATSLAIRSDVTFYSCEDIKSDFEFFAANYAQVYGQNTTAIKQRLESTWLPNINSTFYDGVQISISSINVSYDSSTGKIKVWSGAQTTGVGINITDTSGAIKCAVMSGPLNITVAADTQGPTISISSPENRTYCVQPIDLTYSLSELTISELYNVDGGANTTSSSGLNISGLTGGLHNLTLYATDSSNNTNLSRVYFYIKNYTYVSSYTNTTGIVTNFASAQSATDGDQSANITEVNATTILNYPANREFTLSASGWSESSTGTGITNSHTTGVGNPAGSIYTSISGRGKSGTGQWASNFAYSQSGASSVTLYLDYRVTDYTKPGATNQFSAKLVTPSGNWTDTPVSITGTTGWTTLTRSIPTTYFATPGTYTLQIISSLSTDTTGNPLITVRFDNVKLDVAIPSGYQYDVNFTTADTPVVNWQNHELQIRYRMPSPNGEDTLLYMYDSNTSAWNFIQTLTANTSFTNLSHFMTLSEYNSGNVWVRYVDSNQAGDSNQSVIQVDYHRIC